MTFDLVLKSVLNIAVEKIKLTRWLPELLEYDFEIIHRAPVKCQAEKVLSILPTTVVDHIKL